MTSTLHVAPVVLTMTGPPLRDAGVLVEGDRVVSVGPADAFVDVRVRTHGGVLLPGLVNAHAHLEARPDRELDDPAWLVEARGSVHGLLRTGTTAGADVVTHGPGLRAAALAGLAGVSYVVVDDRWPTDRARVEALLGSAGRTVGLSPRTRSDDVLREVGDLARERGLRLHLRLEEAVRLASLGPDVHVAHAGRLSATDRALLRSRGTAVALCVRGGARTGEVDVAALLGEGSPVALGTGSLGDVPDLDLLAEARAARDLALQQGAPPKGLAEALVRAATVGGAAAIGLTGAGTLAPGVRADLAVFDVPTDGDPYEALLQHGPGRCTATVLAGRLVHRRNPSPDPR